MESGAEKEREMMNHRRKMKDAAGQEAMFKLKTLVPENPSLFRDAFSS